MSKKNRKPPAKRDNSSAIGFLISDEAYSTLCVPGYTSLDHNPEILTGCRRIASLLGSATIHLMNNTESGDERIVNELSRLVDINPMPTMTRPTWIEAIMMNLLLYGRGNSIVLPHTRAGRLEDLEPISARRVSFEPIGYRDYKVLIDGNAFDPSEVCHFVFNPDPAYLWKGRGVEVALKDVANNLKQAAATEKGFMESKWKPSIIVKVDALTDEFSSPAGRKKLLDSYVSSAEVGEPWLIPAEQFQIEQVKPLSLADLAIKDTVEMDKRTVAAILNVPPYVVGVGEYKKDEWNAFIQTTIMSWAKIIAAELTKKILISPKWYWKFNVWSLMDYDLKTVSSVLLEGSDRGYVNGDEWRDRMNMSPAGLKEYKVLENYLPYDMSGKQKKLLQEGD